MGKQKQQTKQTSQQQQQYAGQTTSQYGFFDTPINAQMQAVIDAANAPAGADPAIANRYAAMEQNVIRSKADPLGAYTTPFVRERAQLSQRNSLLAERDKAMREDAFNREQNQFGRLATAASMTAPRFAQTGGTTSGTSSGTSSGNSTTTQGKDMFGNIIDIGLGAASF